jgi:thiol:disulfide interchange protein
MLFIAGFAIALAVSAAVVHHLVKKQGQEVSAAGSKGAMIAVLLCVVTGLVAWITREPVYEGSGKPLVWTSVTTREQLVAEVERAMKEGKSTLFDIRAEWCAACKQYERLMNNDPVLHAKLEKIHLLHLDNTETVEGEAGLREGLDMKPLGQPLMVFIDSKGVIQRPQKVMKWYKATSADELNKRLDAMAEISR